MEPDPFPAADITQVLPRRPLPVTMHIITRLPDERIAILLKMESTRLRLYSSLFSTLWEAAATNVDYAVTDTRRGLPGHVLAVRCPLHIPFLTFLLTMWFLCAFRCYI